MDRSKQTMMRQADFLAPKRLLYQIMLLQLVYYLIGAILIVFYYTISGLQFGILTIFSWEPVRFDTTSGWTLAFLWLLDTFFSVMAMTIIVGRSKLALDFTMTLHGINILVAWLVSGKFPMSMLWWGLQVTSVLLMVSLGTWTSQWRELRHTFFDAEYEMVTNPPSSNSQQQEASTSQNATTTANQ